MLWIHFYSIYHPLFTLHSSLIDDTMSAQNRYALAVSVNQSIENRIFPSHSAFVLYGASHFVGGDAIAAYLEYSRICDIYLGFFTIFRLISYPSWPIFSTLLGRSEQVFRISLEITSMLMVMIHNSGLCEGNPHAKSVSSFRDSSTTVTHLANYLWRTEPFSQHTPESKHAWNMLWLFLWIHEQTRLRRLKATYLESHNIYIMNTPLQTSFKSNPIRSNILRYWRSFGLLVETVFLLVGIFQQSL